MTCFGRRQENKTSVREVIQPLLTLGFVVIGLCKMFHLTAEVGDVNHGNVRCIVRMVGLSMSVA